MPAINGIAHIQLTVSNMERSVPFYETLLHSLEMVTLIKTSEYFYCIGGKTGVAISPAAPEHAAGGFNQCRPGLHHICFRARSREDVDGIHAVALSLGAIIIRPPRQDAWAPGYYSVLFEDPDGIRIEANFVPGKGHLAEPKAARQYVLQTERLGMRRYTMADVDAVGELFADPYAAKFYPVMNTREAHARWIGWNLKNYDDHGFGLWALELLEDGRFIGDAGVTYQTVEGERILEIGWHVHHSFRSRGYATEAAMACLEFAFNRLDAALVGSIVDPANVASIIVASRVHAQKRDFQGKTGPMFLFSTTAHTDSGSPNPKDDT